MQLLTRGNKTMIQDYQQETATQIKQLCKEKNAIILAHNYQLGEVQEIAHFVGDSLELSIKAQNIKEDIIIFCGVKFMAETAAILSPEKTVLLPIQNAGCPMADMATAQQLRDLKAKHPNAIAVCYVNSTAEVKTECHICCTSANAEKIIASIPKEQEIIFLPDQNLGANVANQTKRKMILWQGYCPTHMRITPQQIKQKKQQYPQATVIVHPECSPAVVATADASLSTGGMLKFAKQTKAKQIIVATEIGIIHRLQKENPNKQFIPISEQAICMNMKMTNLEDILYSLQQMKTIVKIDPETRKKALLPIQRMITGKI